MAEASHAQRERLRVKFRDYVYPFLRRAPRGHPQSGRLRNYRPETWRWRLGEWRAFHLIDDQARIVAMVALALRRDAYRK